MRSEPSWIYLPESLVLEASDDGKTYRKVSTLNKVDIYTTYGNRDGRIEIRMEAGVSGRYFRIKAEPEGKIPEGREGAGHKAWLFIDEIEGF
jgi:hexosaminidase